MDKLTKDDFWNPLMEKYPDAVKDFCTWIDEYKKSVDWDYLFGNTANPPAGEGRPWAHIKFHHIPGPMQFGVLLYYFSQKGGCYWEFDVFNDDWLDLITNAFADEQLKYSEQP